jgi:hypothetical protein
MLGVILTYRNPTDYVNICTGNNYIFQTKFMAYSDPRSSSGLAVCRIEDYMSSYNRVYTNQLFNKS